MTEEQKKMLVAKIDAAANKDIPKSAWWHMRHRPYEESMLRHKEQQIITGFKTGVNDQQSTLMRSERHHNGGDKDVQGSE